MSGSGGPELAAVRDLFAAEIERGLETGVQLSVAHRGQVVDVAVGENGRGDALTSESYVPWTCSSKPLGALAFAESWDKAAVDLDTRVAEILPEFGGGKETVTLRHLLTHTTGSSDPVMALGAGAGAVPSWAEMNALIWAVICAAPTRVPPGTAMIYNPVTNWYVLDRVLGAITGEGSSYRSFGARLGLAISLGLDPSIPVEQQVTVHAPSEEQGGLQAMQLASMLPLPGVGVWGPMHQLRVVGEVLLARGRHDGRQIVSSAGVEALTATHWPGSRYRSICETDFPYGLGVMTGPAIFGRRCSFRTYGHAGGNTSTLLVDPLFELVVAVYWNGRLDNVRTFARRYALVRALYDDLDLPRLPSAVADSPADGP